MKRMGRAILVLAALLTLALIVSPISYAPTCRCGGCCVGCPDDCTTIGAPLPYAYWGVNGLTAEEVFVVSWIGLLADLIVWMAILLGLVRFARRLSL